MTQFERMQNKRGGNTEKIGDHLKPEIWNCAEICNFEKLSRKSANSKTFNDKSEIFPIKIAVTPDLMPIGNTLSCPAYLYLVYCSHRG